MPAYPWLFEKETDVKSLPGKIAAQVKLGVPWPAMNQHEIRDMVETQSQEIAKSLVDAKVYLPAKPDLQGDALRNHLAKSQVVAIIAYVQKLGSLPRGQEATRPGAPSPWIRTPTARRHGQLSPHLQPTSAAMFKRVFVEDWALLSSHSSRSSSSRPCSYS